MGWYTQKVKSACHVWAGCNNSPILGANRVILLLLLVYVIPFLAAGACLNLITDRQKSVLQAASILVDVSMDN